MKLGAVNYITKPLDIELLKRSLQNWATQILTKQLMQVKTLALEYDEEKFKTILDLFSKKGYNIKCVDSKDAKPEAEERQLDLLILRLDILGDGGVELLLKYRQVFPELPVMVAFGKNQPPELADRIKDCEGYGYLPAFVSSSGLIIIAYKLISDSKEKARIKRG
jgi:hypothetical protein